MKATNVNKYRFIVSMIDFSLVLVFGIVFLTLFLTGDREIPENYVETNATITRIDEVRSPVSSSDGIEYDYYVYVEYTYNGKTYTDKEYDRYYSGMKAGNTVLLYLDPDNPEKYKCDPSDDYLFVIVGVVVVLIGVGGIAYNVRKRERERGEQ